MGVVKVAFYDWNHNGKKDRQDDYLEYEIYKKSTQTNTGDSVGCSTYIYIILGFLFIINLLAQCSN